MNKNQNKQYITRLVELDIGHRVMNEHVKCYSIHGHRVKIELTFSYVRMQDIGYCIDFKEIKRVGGQWLDDYMDHGFIANPLDEVMIEACQKTNSKLYLMSLNGPDAYCNPTAENVSREIFMALEILFEDYTDLTVHSICYHETPNCSVLTEMDSINPEERRHFHQYRHDEIKKYAKDKGVMEYDSRKISN